MPPRVPERDRRRALTLLELLIVVALLASLGALVLPAISVRLDRQVYDSTIDLLQGQLQLARAYAQLERRSVEVVYRFDPSDRLRGSRVEVRGFVAGEGSSVPPGTGEEPTMTGNGGATDARTQVPENDETPRGGLVPRRWSIQPIAEAITINVDGPPEGLSDGLLPTGFEMPRETRGPPTMGEPSTRFRIALFLPDGSAIVDRPVWIGHDDGRWGRLVVSSFTGWATFDPWDPDQPFDDEVPQEDMTTDEDLLDEEGFDPFADDEATDAGTDDAGGRP